MDEIARSNQSKWDELARHGVLYARPLLDLTPESAREWLDPHNRLGDLREKNVLCLAGGGGKQSAAFGCLGARVTVQDLSSEMLLRDRLAAEHYQYQVDLRQEDMRDLSPYPDHKFDLVFQPYSLNYISDPRPVFSGVARVLRPGGMYVFELGNPFTLGLFEADWNGNGYPLRNMYRDGAEIPNPVWRFDDSDGQAIEMPGPRTFRHTLGGVLTFVAGLGFGLIRLEEEAGSDTELEPGTWDHYKSIVVPWMTVWLRKEG